MMCQPKPPLMSDYDRSITKSWEKKSNRRYNQVPQLGEQPKQSVPPLVVLSKEDEATAEFVKEMNLTKTQLLGQEKIPVHQGAGRKPFVLGEPLMWPELITPYQQECVSYINVFDEILYHMSYISDMDHVCYISKQKEKRSKEMKRG